MSSGTSKPPSPKKFAEGPVFSANGGSAAYRRGMLELVGLLDEDFFFSCEDVDLAWRAQLAGWPCVYAPGAVVYHKLSASGGGVTASFHDGRNFLYLLAKDVPACVWRRYWPKIISGQLRLTAAALRAWRGAAAVCLALLLAPWGCLGASVAVQAGDILLVNHGDNSVYRINATSGEQRRLGVFQVPTDLVISPDGYLYISEYRGTIQRLNLTNGTISVVNPQTSLWNVNGPARAANGDLYLTCAGSNTVVRVNPITGAESVITQGDLLSVPIGVDLLDAGHLVVSSLKARCGVLSLRTPYDSTIRTSPNVVATLPALMVSFGPRSDRGP